MKILFLTPQLPYPPRQGTTIRNYNLIRLLAQEHQIHLFTFLASGEQYSQESHLAALCERIVTADQPARSLARRGLDTLASNRPDMGLRLASPVAHARLAALLAEETYDLVQVEGIEMASYGLAATAIQPRARLIFDDHNVEYLLQKRSALVDLRRPLRWPAALYSLIQWNKLHRYERMICSRADAVIAVSEPDRSALVQFVPDGLVDVVPNGIDLSEYPLARPVQNTDEQPTLVFTGKMDYRPNVDAILWFVGEVLPLIQARQPDVRLQVVGMSPHRRLAALRGSPGVEITGAVADVRPYVYAAAVYVVPLRVGGGTRFKVLEALASGKPIVSTSLGVEGLGLQDGRELLLADEPQHFAQAVLRLLDDQARNGLLAGTLSQALSSAGRHFVEAHFTWEQIVPRLEQVYQAVMRMEPLASRQR
ncbi:MAG: glycosyltransferase [Caldilineaceae bacterium]